MTNFELIKAKERFWNKLDRVTTETGELVLAREMKPVVRDYMAKLYNGERDSFTSRDRFEFGIILEFVDAIYTKNNISE